MERKDLIFMASEAGFGKLLTGDGLPSMWHGADLEMLERFAELVADHERVAAELRCAKTPVLLDGHHGYTALKVQEMMMAAVSMRSNDEAHRKDAAGGLSGGAGCSASDATGERRLK